jgi:hypothetical protein
MTQHRALPRRAALLLGVLACALVVAACASDASSSGGKRASTSPDMAKPAATAAGSPDSSARPPFAPVVAASELVVGKNRFSLGIIEQETGQPLPDAQVHFRFFTDEQLRTLEDISRSSYSNEARAALGARPAWTEADQRRVDEQYAALYAGVRRAVAAGQDAAGAEAQALAGQAVALIEAFTGGNPAVEAGLQTWWKTYQALPAEQRPFQVPLTEAEAAFLERAKAIYLERQRTPGDA